MALLDKLWQRRESRQQSATEQYRTLIHRLAITDKEPNDKDVELLDSLTGQLNYQRSQVESDLEASKRVNELTPVASKQEEHLEASRQAGKAQQKALAEWDAEQRKRTAEHAALDAKRQQANALHREAYIVGQEIETIKKSKPHLF